MMKRAYDQEQGNWSLPEAVPVWLFASIAGWIAFIGLYSASADFDEHALGAISEALCGLTNLATASGAPRP